MMFSRLKGEPDRSEPFVVSTTELEQFRRSAYRPELATLIVVGKFDTSAMRREIEKLFGGWRGGPKVPPLPSTPMTARIRSFVAIPDAKSPTVDLAIGFAAKGPERMARAVLEAILQDRLRVIREGLGISYGVHADVNNDAVLIVGSVEPAFAKDAATALTTELTRIRDGGADLEIDFARARRRVLARALARPIGPGVRANALQRIAIDGRPVSDLDRDLAEIRALDFATFRAIATRVLRVDLMLAAVRGDEARLEPVLRALGASTIERWH
jgi:zinc protease